MYTNIMKSENWLKGFCHWLLMIRQRRNRADKEVEIVCKKIISLEQKGG